MNDMPEQIFAWYFKPSSRNEVMLGGWDTTEDRRTVKYIRADLTKPNVKPLEWEPGIVHWAQPLPGIKYVACSSEGSTWVWWLEGVWRTRMVPSSVHESESAAKAAAQADYEQRILSALENT